MYLSTKHSGLALPCWRSIIIVLMILMHISLLMVSYLIAVCLAYLFSQQIVLDPVLKLEYFTAACDDEYLCVGMD